MAVKLTPWARGPGFWNLYGQLGLRVAILLAYIVALSALLRGSATLGATYGLSYTMVAVSIVYNGLHVWRLHHLLGVERRPGQSSADVGCVICLEIAAAITTGIVGFLIFLVDTDSWGLGDCSSEECEPRKELERAKGVYLLYAMFCLWTIAGLHFLLVVFVSMQCCVNRGLDRPEPATSAARLRRAENGVRNSPGNDPSPAEEDNHELPAYQPPHESTTSIAPLRLSDEPPAYNETTSSPELRGPAADSTTNNQAT